MQLQQQKQYQEKKYSFFYFYQFSLVLVPNFLELKIFPSHLLNTLEINSFHFYVVEYHKSVRLYNNFVYITIRFFLNFLIMYL